MEPGFGRRPTRRTHCSPNIIGSLAKQCLAFTQGRRDAPSYLSTGVLVSVARLGFGCAGLLQKADRRNLEPVFIWGGEKEKSGLIQQLFRIAPLFPLEFFCPSLPYASSTPTWRETAPCSLAVGHLNLSVILLFFLDINPQILALPKLTNLSF